MKINKIMGNLFVKILRLKGIQIVSLSVPHHYKTKIISFIANFLVPAKMQNVSYYEAK